MAKAHNPKNTREAAELRAVMGLAPSREPEKEPQNKKPSALASLGPSPRAASIDASGRRASQCPRYLNGLKKGQGNPNLRRKDTGSLLPSVPLFSSLPSAGSDLGNQQSKMDRLQITNPKTSAKSKDARYLRETDTERDI